MAERQEEFITISELQEITKLPASALRFYETEFASYLQVQKNPDAARKYSPGNVRKFLHLKHLIQEQGMSIREAKEAINSDEDPQKIREEVDLLLKVTEQLTKENQQLRKSLQALEERLANLEDEIQARSKTGFRWFR